MWIYTVSKQYYLLLLYSLASKIIEEGNITIIVRRKIVGLLRVIIEGHRSFIWLTLRHNQLSGRRRMSAMTVSEMQFASSRD